MVAETHKNQEKWRYCPTVFTFIYLSIQAYLSIYLYTEVVKQQFILRHNVQSKSTYCILFDEYNMCPAT